MRLSIIRPLHCTRGIIRNVYLPTSNFIDRLCNQMSKRACLTRVYVTISVAGWQDAQCVLCGPHVRILGWSSWSSRCATVIRFVDWRCSYSTRVSRGVLARSYDRITPHLSHPPIFHFISFLHFHFHLWGRSAHREAVLRCCCKTMVKPPMSSLAPKSQVGVGTELDGLWRWLAPSQLASSRTPCPSLLCVREKTPRNDPIRSSFACEQGGGYLVCTSNWHPNTVNTRS